MAIRHVLNIDADGQPVVAEVDEDTTEVSNIQPINPANLLLIAAILVEEMGGSIVIENTTVKQNIAIQVEVVDDDYLKNFTRMDEDPNRTLH